MSARNILITLASLSLTVSVSAQDFNLDLGDPTLGVPANTYSAAGSQAGLWTPVDGGFGAIAMLDIAGVATGAALTPPPVAGNYAFDHAGTSGDDQLLMDDISDPGGTGDYVFNGLADGSYTVYTYAWAPDSDTFRVDISIAGAVEGPQSCGGVWAGGHQLGVTFTVHHVDVTGGDLVVSCTLTSGFASINGFQLILDGSGNPGTNYCTSNPNSTGSAAVISATGTNSIAANDLVLVSQPVPNQPGIFFYADNQLQVPFGNGFLCAAGTISRLPVVVASGNVATFPVDYATVPTLGPIVAGSDWNFQYWYRDPAAGGAFFNTSDGYNIVFVP